MPPLSSGLRFTKLVVVAYLGMVNGRGIYKVKCDCGKELVVNRQKLVGLIRKSCGCLRQFNTETLFNEIIRRYKRQALKRGFEWALETSRAIELFNRHCRYCGVAPSNTQTSTDGKHSRQYSGIDRIDPNKGYFRENCVPCCVTCNRAKSDKTLSEFSEWLDRAYTHHFRD